MFCLFQLAASAATEAATPAAEEKKADSTKVPEYHFISSMAGYGTPLPTSTPVAVEKKKAKKNIFASFMGMFKGAAAPKATVAAGQA